MIGNSLTNDTKPGQVDDAEWSVYCGKNLQYIHDNPAGYCVDTSLRWDEALVQNSYDYVTVQPFAGTVRSQDAAVISSWMQLQPDAVFVLHTGWRGYEEHVEAYESTGNWEMKPSPAYFEALERDLAKLQPGREVRRTRSAEVLYEIALDIEGGIGPFGSLSELYRDDIHMDYTYGRYLMNNLMRLALDQDYVLRPDATADAKTRYLNTKLVALVPEPTTLGLLFAGLPLVLRRRARRG